MSKVASEVRVGGDWELYAAPLGTAGPTTSVSALDPTYVGLGFNNDEGLTVTRSIEVEDIVPGQIITPVRRVPTSQEFSVAGTFMQSNEQNTKLFYGTGDFTEPDPVGAPGEFKASASTDPDIVERAVVMEMADGTINYRIFIPKAEVRANGDVTVNRATNKGYPLVFTALAPDTGSLYDVLTDDPAMAA